ncbi:MAG: lysozyme [bacterium]
MKTGARGLKLIKDYEGYLPTAYQDSVGVWTIGYGHTAATGPPTVKPGMRLSKAGVDALLASVPGRWCSR